MRFFASIFLNTKMFYLIILFPVLAFAQTEIETKKVNFEKGKSETTIKGTLKGDQIIDYILTANKDQVINVKFTATNTANYFNLMSPGEEYVAYYNSSMDENYYEGKLEKSGDQKIRVYLMRSAARRNESSTFTIEVSIASGN